MGLAGFRPSERSQTEKDRCHVISPRKQDKGTKQKQTPRSREQVGGYQRGRELGEGCVAEGTQLHGDGW